MTLSPDDIQPLLLMTRIASQVTLSFPCKITFIAVWLMRFVAKISLNYLRMKRAFNSVGLFFIVVAYSTLWFLSFMQLVVCFLFVIVVFVNLPVRLLLRVIIVALIVFSSFPSCHSLYLPPAWIQFVFTFGQLSSNTYPLKWSFYWSTFNCSPLFFCSYYWFHLLCDSYQVEIAKCVFPTAIRI